MLFQNRRAMSLVELLVAMAVLCLVLAPIAMSLTGGMKAYRFNMAQSRNVMSTRELLNAISDELRYATAISVASGTTVTLPNATIAYTVGGQARTLYATAGSSTNIYNFVIAYNGVAQKTISINNLQSVEFTHAAANPKMLDIAVKENDASYTGSPTLITTTTLTMPNITK